MRKFVIIVALAYLVPLLLFVGQVRADDCTTDTECEAMQQAAFTAKHHS